MEHLYIFCVFWEGSKTCTLLARVPDAVSTHIPIVSMT
jgi:hypothetical protein